MNIPLGRILKIDMGESKSGRVVYLVVRPPIICTECEEVISDWRKDENGYIICPFCEETITQENYVQCSCGENDLIRLRVVQNNNWGIDSDGHINELNNKVFHGITVCKKSLEDDIRSGEIKLLNAKDTVDCKRKIEWTNSSDYDPSKEMPDYIKEKWKYEDQE